MEGSQRPMLADSSCAKLRACCRAASPSASALMRSEMSSEDDVPS